VAANPKPRTIFESASHQPLLTWPSLSSHANGGSTSRAKIYPQPTSMFFWLVLVCFWGRACELNVVCREEHPDAECRSGSTLAEAAVADDRLKRKSICPVPNISAKTTALMEITHRVSLLRAHTELD
jgi:hypothetical protein